MTLLRPTPVDINPWIPLTGHGIALTLFPADANFDFEIQRAPDSGGLPLISSAEIVARVTSDVPTWTDKLPADGARRHYRYRHVRDGYDPSPWTCWVSDIPRLLGIPVPVAPIAPRLAESTTENASQGLLTIVATDPQCRLLSVEFRTRIGGGNWSDYEVAPGPVYEKAVDTSQGRAFVGYRASFYDADGVVRQHEGEAMFGTDGLSTAVVYLYRRSASLPAVPGTSLTYTFATGALSGSLAGWSQTIPAADGNPLYVTAATASSTGATDTIAPNEWASPVVLAQDGADGSDGDPGLNAATIYLFRRSASVPAVPDNSITYTFASGATSGSLDGWSRTVPAHDGNPLYVTTATAISASATDTIAPEEWATPQIHAQDGQQGPQGDQGIQGPPGADGTSSYFHIAYADSADGTVNFNQTSGTYVGTYVDSNPVDSSDPADYNWQQFRGAQGPQGDQGIPGTDGEDGQTSYLHIAYADTSSGGGFSQNPNGKRYIGTYVDFTQADSSNPGDYTWALMRGADSGRIIYETFAEIPPGMNSTSGVSIVDVPGTAGGKVMQVAGGFRLWHPGLSRAVPWDPNTLYRIEVRMRVLQDDSTEQQRFYAGVQTYDASGATVGNNGGRKYVAASAQTPVAADGWVTYVGWLRGEGAVNSNAWDPSTPSGIGADSAQTAYIAPMLLLNYNSPTDQVTQVDYFKIEAVPAWDYIAEVEQAAADAIAAAAGAQATADGKVTTFFGSAAPTAEGVGDLWIHTGEGNRLYRWDGSEWAVGQDQGIAAAIAAAATAQETADGKIRTFYQTTPPTGMTVDDVGDLWFDTDDQNHLYRWSGTQWTSMRDGSAVRTLPPLGWVEVTQAQTGNVTVRYAGVLGENGEGPLEWQRVIVNNDSGTFSWPATWETATLPQTEQVVRLPKNTRVIHFRVRDAGGYISAPFSLPIDGTLGAIRPIDGRINDTEPMGSGHLPFRRGLDTLDDVENSPTHRKPGAGYVDTFGRVGAIFDTETGVLRDGGFVGGGASRARAGLTAAGRLSSGVEPSADIAGTAASVVRAQALSPTQNRLGPWARSTLVTAGNEHGQNTLEEMQLSPGDVISVSAQLRRVSGAGFPRLRVDFRGAPGEGTIASEIVTATTSAKTRVALENYTIPAGTVTIGIVYLQPTGAGTTEGGYPMLNLGPIALPYEDPPLRGGRETFADLDADADARVYGTIDGPGRLAATTVIRTPVVALNIAKGIKTGVVEDGGQVFFDPPFDLPPVVTFSPGGITYHAELSGSQQVSVVPLNLSATGFTCQAVIREVFGALQQRFSASFSGTVAQKNVAAAAYDHTYTFRYSVTLPAAFVPGGGLPQVDAKVTLSFATNTGDGPIVRTTRSYINSTTSTITYSNQEQSVVVPNMTSASHTFILSMEAEGPPGATITRNTVTWWTAAAVESRSMTPTGVGGIPFMAITGT